MNRSDNSSISWPSSRHIHWSPQTPQSTWQAWLQAHPVDWQKIAGLLPVIIQDILSRQVLMQGYMNPEALEQSLSSGKVVFYSRSKQRLWCKGETSGNFLHIRELALDCDADSLLILATPCGPTCHQGSNSCYSFPLAQAPSVTNNKELERLGADFGHPGPHDGPHSAEGPEHGGHGGHGEHRESLGAGWLAALERIIEQRSTAQPKTNDSQGQKDSYVQHLFRCGVQRIAQKVGEEGVEVALAAMALHYAQQNQAQPTQLAQADCSQTEQERQTTLRQELAGEAGDLLFHLLILLKACNMNLQDVIAVLEQRHRQALEKSNEPSTAKP